MVLTAAGQYISAGIQSTAAAGGLAAKLLPDFVGTITDTAGQATISPMLPPPLLFMSRHPWEDSSSVHSSCNRGTPAKRNQTTSFQVGKASKGGRRLSIRRYRTTKRRRCDHFSPDRQKFSSWRDFLLLVKLPLSWNWAFCSQRHSSSYWWDFPPRRDFHFLCCTLPPWRDHAPLWKQLL